jgi:hypothetical protein
MTILVQAHHRSLGDRDRQLRIDLEYTDFAVKIAAVQWYYILAIVLEILK